MKSRRVQRARTGQRVLLFCHDPTALPFFMARSSVRSRLGQIEQTVIGHLHSKLVFWNSKMLAGMPVIRFFGHTAQRMSTALHEARRWKPFHVRLCPSLAGIGTHERRAATSPPNSILMRAGPPGSSFTRSRVNPPAARRRAPS